MITFKEPLVRAYQIAPQVFAALAKADGIWISLGAAELVVTSLNDGSHSTGSLHYKGLAADLRTHNLPSPQARVEAWRRLKAALGSAYDVLHEHVGTPNEHVHLEYDPQ